MIFQGGSTHRRKLQQDAICEEDVEIIYGYWTYMASQPTGDKRDVVKKSTAKQQYIQHAKHSLEINDPSYGLKLMRDLRF